MYVKPKQACSLVDYSNSEDNGEGSAERPFKALQFYF